VRRRLSQQRHVGRVKTRLAELLSAPETGLVVDPNDFSIAVGHYRTSKYACNWPWEAEATRRSDGFRVTLVGRSTMTACIKRGFTITPEDVSWRFFVDAKSVIP